ncbi:hypothetical protein OB236_39800 [Paenibacillus sp. WQ 127069]|uniref:Lipoprotein n=1 Tax=Paenibacillus baimaensis TaxID=2982185 RepID=A0ABT2UVW7_9BACL|nr:hypothetical protein [Paenibacillus sp. WQ 127069]MCU6798291.1 hypothetical protein [Paenibacillus sp. WQ 127069]
MRKWSIIACVIATLSGCSPTIDDAASKIRSVHTELTKQNGLEHWKLALIPKYFAPGQQNYDLEFQNSGDISVQSVTVYYRVDIKEKLSGTIVKPDSKTVVSKLDPNEKLTLSDLNLPIDTPISVEVDWLEGNRINKGTGVFRITEIK